MYTLLGLVSAGSLLLGAAVVVAAPSCPKITTEGAFCFRSDQALLSRFDVCGKTAVVCTSLNGGDDECAAVDLDTGKYRRATLAPAVAQVRVEQQGTAMNLCVGERCVATDLPVSSDPYEVELSDEACDSAQRARYIDDDCTRGVDDQRAGSGRVELCRALPGELHRRLRDRAADHAVPAR